MSNEPKATRAPRENATRTEAARQAQWTAPSVLPDPNPRPGFVHRWIRLSIFGQVDPTNMNTRMREGWTPVLSSEYPEIQTLVAESDRFSDNVVIGGLILCKAPTDLMLQRDAAHRALAASQIDAVDNNYLREADPRMPMLRPERSTRVTTGSRSRDS
jgi:hypothetical protein